MQGSLQCRGSALLGTGLRGFVVELRRGFGAMIGRQDSNAVDGVQVLVGDEAADHGPALVRDE